MSQSKKKSVNIRFRFNKETGEIEDLIVDDNTPDASEKFHDDVAQLIASQLGARPLIRDAGPIRFDSHTQRTSAEREEKSSEGEMIND